MEEKTVCIYFIAPHLATLPARGSTRRLNARLPDPVYPGYAGAHVLIETRIGLTLLQLRLSVLCGAPPEFGGIQAMALSLSDFHGKSAARFKAVQALRPHRTSREQPKAAGKESNNNKLNYLKTICDYYRILCEHT